MLALQVHLRNRRRKLARVVDFRLLVAAGYSSDPFFYRKISFDRRESLVL